MPTGIPPRSGPTSGGPQRRRGVGMSLPDLAAVLWRQRELLEHLAYKLECERLLMTTGRTRWLAAATSEVEIVTDEVALLKLQRAAVADAVCRELELEP